MYQLHSAGIECFDILTKRGAYAGLVVKKRDGYALYWNSSATRGSKKRFSDIAQALEFVHQRRINKGWAH